MFKSNYTNVLRKSGLGAILIVTLSTNVFAQDFNLLSDNRYLVVYLSGQTGGYQTPTAPFADVNANFSSSNSINDYYTAVQDSSATPTQLVCNTYINLQSTVPPGKGSSVGSYCAINFSVSNPVTVDFTINNFYVSDAGITYDGAIPAAGIQSDDPNLNSNYVLNAFGNQSAASAKLTLQPGYTYTFFEQMTGFGLYDPTGESPDQVNIAWQANLSLTLDSTASSVPEPSSVLLLTIGLTALSQLRRLRQHSK